MTTSTCAGAKVQGINMMKEELLDSYNGYHLGLPMYPMEPPSLSLPLGDDHSDDDAICEPPQPRRGRKREEFVALGLEMTLNNFFSLEFLELLCFNAHGEKGPMCAPQRHQSGPKDLQGPWFGHQKPKGVPGTSVVAWGAITL